MTTATTVRRQIGSERNESRMNGAYNLLARRHAVRYDAFMRIVIATGIFPPEVGGPSFYSAALQGALEAQGHSVRVVLYGRLKQLPPGVRHLLYALKLVRHARWADGIIAFDTYSVGLPVVIAGLFVRRPTIVRIGGDFMWEMYTERSGDLVTLPQVYERRDKWTRKERLNFALQKWVIGRVDLAFSCGWIRNIWRHVYTLDEARSHVVENAIPPRETGTPPSRKNFLFYTRPLALKNNAAFRQAFEQARVQRPEITLEEGVVPHEELMSRMREGYAVVLPSISDVTPNYILDAIRFGKPFLLTKYSGYAEPFKDLGIIIDPFSIDDMTRGILALADEAQYAAQSARIKAFTQVRTYDDIAREFISILQRT